MIPACRIAPPNNFRARRASWTNSDDPASAEPTGAPRPLLKQTLTESNGSARSCSLSPVATEAFHKRAPSRCFSQAVCFGPFANPMHFVLRLNSSTPPIVGVLQAHQPGPDHVFVVRSDQAPELVDFQHATLPQRRSERPARTAVRRHPVHSDRCGNPPHTGTRCPGHNGLASAI